MSQPVSTTDGDYGHSTREPALDRLEVALRNLQAEPLTQCDKGVPAGIDLTLGDVGRQRWSICGGDLPVPSMVVRQAALQHNIALMQSYCDDHGAWFAPHGKTTMAPQIFYEQLRRGAWAITVANVAQLQVCRSFGIPRVFFANEPVTSYDIGYMVKQLNAEPDFKLFVLVDSLQGVERLAHHVHYGTPSRPLPVLVELGMLGGRCGARTVAEVVAIGEAVLKHPAELQLVGVEGFEGIVAGNTPEEQLAAVDLYLGDLASSVRMFVDRTGRRPFLVSAGGSVFFDRVVAYLGRDNLPEAQLVLRSGGYVTHDSGILYESSPLSAGSERQVPGERLQPALEAWASVLSRPEPDLAIVGLGRRDVPTDAGLPIPLYRAVPGKPTQLLGDGFAFDRVNDQHAYLRMPLTAAMEPGDLVGSGISHPCTAFDRWRTLFVVDDERTVIGAMRTFF